MNQQNHSTSNHMATQRHGWMWMLFSGVMSMVLGGLLIAMPFVTMVVYGQVTGAFMMVGGVFGLFAVGNVHGNRRSVWLWMLPLLGGLLGALLFFRPQLAIEAMMMTLGTFAIVGGVYGLVATFAAWDHLVHHWVALVFAVMTILAGVCMASYPPLAIWVFGIWFGVSYLFNGAYQLFGVADARRAELAS